MSDTLRGQEITIRIAVDGQVQTGSFFRVTEFSVTERGDLTEEDYLGEDESEIDYQHHGFDFSFGVNLRDAKTLEFLRDLIDRQRTRRAYPAITMTVFYNFRGGGDRDRVEVYNRVFLRPTERGFSGRKEHVTERFEGKCRAVNLMTA